MKMTCTQPYGYVKTQIVPSPTLGDGKIVMWLMFNSTSVISTSHCNLQLVPRCHFLHPPLPTTSIFVMPLCFPSLAKGYGLASALWMGFHGIFNPFPIPRSSYWAYHQFDPHSTFTRFSACSFPTLWVSIPRSWCVQLTVHDRCAHVFWQPCKWCRRCVGAWRTELSTYNHYSHVLLSGLLTNAWAV